MSLISKVKSAKTRGSQVYAIVELAILGRATVLLVGSDQRMTNLPVYGRAVKTGDTVIIDYSAEGQPYVRAAISSDVVATPRAEIIVDEGIVDTKDGFVAGKVTLSSNRIFSDTIAGDTFTWTPIDFDDVLYDNRSLWSDAMFGELPTGQYLANVNLGFSYNNYVSGYCSVQVLNYKASTLALTPVDFRIPYSQDVQFYGGADHNIHVVNFSTMCRISDPDEAIGLAFCVYTSGYIQPTVLKAYSWFSLHKLKNLSPETEQSIRGFWDPGGTYF